MCVIRFVFLCVFSAASPPSSPSPTTVLPSTPPEKTTPKPIVKEIHETIDPSTSITETITKSVVVAPYKNVVDENIINEPSYQNTAAIIKNVDDVHLINDENNSNITSNDNNLESSITNKITTTTTTTTTENVNGNLNSKTSETVESPGTNNNGRMEQLYDIPVGE